MKQEFFNLQINTNGQKLYEFTDQTLNWINGNNFKQIHDEILRIKTEQRTTENNKIPKESMKCQMDQ